MIIHGDSLHEMKNLADDSVDLVCTDPPYGYSFMGKNWDKAVPSVEIWQECLRVLKPGAFCMVMSAPRSDVQMHMIQNLTQAGFRLDFTPIYWTYASGFPKAGNIGKLVDKRLGVERQPTTGSTSCPDFPEPCKGHPTANGSLGGGVMRHSTPSKGTSELEGSYAGFQPKPAVEVIIVAMKPLSEKTFVDQALANGKGVTWLDDSRIPTGENLNGGAYSGGQRSDGEWNDKSGFKNDKLKTFEQPQGRFPANLLVSDDVLNENLDDIKDVLGSDYEDYVEPTVRPTKNDKSRENAVMFSEYKNQFSYGDKGSYSRYFDLDKWASTLPFLIVPKASKREKNEGLSHLPDSMGLGAEVVSKGGTAAVGNHNPTCAKCGGEKYPRQLEKNTACTCETPDWKVPQNKPTKNAHPTVKPVRLMSYLITLGSRPGDTVLDPFAGSGTTIVAAEMLDRKGIGIERESEYVEIAQARLEHEKAKVKQESLL